MPTTTKYALRYPALTNPADVPADMTNLANDVDAAFAGFGQGTTAARPAAGKTGRIYWATDTTILYYDDGTTWRTVGFIAGGSVTLAMLAADSVDSSKIVNGSIATADIADGAITLIKLASSSVDSSKIVDLSIVSTDIADNAIITAKISNAQITQAKMAAASVGAPEIIDLSVGTAELADGSVTLIKHAANSVDASKIVDGTVGTAELADGSVTTLKLLDANVTLAKLAANSVDAARIVDLSVGTAELADGSVTLAKHAASSVDSSKIVDGTIVDADLAADTLTARVIAANAIGASELADASVDTAAIIDGAVTSLKIADGSIVAADLAAGAAAGNIAAGAITSAMIADGTIVAGDIAASTITYDKLRPGDTYIPSNVGSVFPTGGLFNGYRFTLLMASPGGGIGGYVATDCVYRPDLDGTYPWHVCGSAELTTNVAQNVGNDGGYNYYSLVNQIAVPRTGWWCAFGWVGSSTGGGGGCLARLVVSSTPFTSFGWGNAGHHCFNACAGLIGAGGPVVMQGQSSPGNTVFYSGQIGCRPMRLI